MVRQQTQNSGTHNHPQYPNPAPFWPEATAGVWDRIRPRCRCRGSPWPGGWPRPRGFRPRCPLITNHPRDHLPLGLPLVTDLWPFQGPAGGLLTALFYARTPWVLAVVVDNPFLTPGTGGGTDGQSRQGFPARRGLPVPLGPGALSGTVCGAPAAAIDRLFKRATAAPPGSCRSAVRKSSPRKGLVL